MFFVRAALRDLTVDSNVTVADHLEDNVGNIDGEAGGNSLGETPTPPGPMGKVEATTRCVSKVQ